MGHAIACAALKLPQVDVVFISGPVTAEFATVSGAKNISVTAPIYSYKHLRSESVIMGVVYTNTVYPAYLQGALIFADYNWDRISYMRIQDGEHGKIHPLIFDTPDTSTSGPSHIIQSPDGRIWYTVYSGDPGKSEVRRILYTNQP